MMVHKNRVVMGNNVLAIIKDKAAANNVQDNPDNQVKVEASKNRDSRASQVKAKVDNVQGRDKVLSHKVRAVETVATSAVGQ